MDRQIIELFKRWQEKEGKYPDLDIEAVEFEEKDIGDIVSMMKKGKTPKYAPATEITDCIVIKSGQARGGDNQFDFTKKSYLRQDVIDKEDERNLKPGDILINSTGVGTAGRVTRFDMEGCYVADSHIIILRFDKDLYSSHYILRFFQNFGFKRLESMAVGTGGQVELSQDKIKSIRIPIPKNYNSSYSSKSIQQAIVEFLDYRLGLTQATRDQIDPIRENVELLDRMILPKIFEMKDKYLREQFDKWAKINGYNIDAESFRFELKQLNQIALFPALRRFSGKTDISIQEYQSLDNDLKQNYFALITGTTENNQVSGYIHNDRIPEGALSSPNVISWTRINGKYFFLQENPVCTNDDSFVMEVNNENFTPFVRLSLINTMSYSAFNWSNKAGKTKVKGLEILMPVPISEYYSSYQIQKIIVKFYGAFEKFRDKVINTIDDIHQKANELDEATIAKTFKRNQ